LPPPVFEAFLAAVFNTSRAQGDTRDSFVYSGIVHESILFLALKTSVMLLLAPDTAFDAPWVEAFPAAVFNASRARGQDLTFARYPVVYSGIVH